MQNELKLKEQVRKFILCKIERLERNEAILEILAELNEFSYCNRTQSYFLKSANLIFS